MYIIIQPCSIATVISKIANSQPNPKYVLKHLFVRFNWPFLELCLNKAFTTINEWKIKTALNLIYSNKVTFIYDIRKGWIKERKERMNERTKGKYEWKDERKGWMKGRKEWMNERTKGKDEWNNERKRWMKGRKETMNEWMIERIFLFLIVPIQHLISHFVLKESVHGYWEGSKIKD